MKYLIASALGALCLTSFAQGSSMMNGNGWGGGWMGGYGGFWMAIAAIAVVALVVWAILQNKK